mgnify:FL=1
MDLSKDLKYIKKKYGEQMMHYCRECFPTILNIPGKLVEILNKHFYYVKDSLYDDIKENHKEEEFNDFVYSNAGLKNEYDIRDVSKTPKELLDDAGYDFFECKTVEEVNSFKKYFSKDEQLCTFLDPASRLENKYVFFAVKKNILDIKREDFLIPDRQDEYGTSVISIQFTRNKNNHLSIKNRYNELVNNPDSTFDNNLDNIIPGLTMSFYKAYGIREIYDENSEFQIDNYISIDEEYYKYNYELNDIYYCTNNIIVDNGNVIKYDPEKYIIMDYFIIDLVNKKIDVYDNKIRDSFSDVIGKIKNIEIVRGKKDKKVYITNKEDNIFELTLSFDNKLIGIKNNMIDKLPNRFLISGQYLKNMEFSNVREIGNDVLYANTDLEYFNLSKAKVIGNYFLANNIKLTNIDLNKTIIIGDDFLKRNIIVESINFDSLQRVGNNFMFSNKGLSSIVIPNLSYAGKCFFKSNDKVLFASFPSLQETGDFFMNDAKNLRMFEADNLRVTGDMFLMANKELDYISLPNLIKTGKLFLAANQIIMSVNLPNLSYLPKYFLRNAGGLESITLADDCTWDAIYNKKLLELMYEKKEKTL